MEFEDEMKYLGVGLMVGGAVSIITNSIAGGFTLIAYGIAGAIRDKQHTGKWFP